VLGGDEEGLLGRGGDQSASGQVIGFAGETAGSLLDGGDRRLLQGVAFQATKGQMVEQLVRHFLPGDALEMATGDDPGSQGPGRCGRPIDRPGGFDRPG